MSALLTLKNVSTYVQKHTDHPIKILNQVNLTVEQGDFIVVLGSNGAGKSTLFNAIAGDIAIDEGQLQLRNHDITKQNDVQRTQFLSRVFQDPKAGTAPRMTVAENLLLAQRRGLSRRLRLRGLAQQRAYFSELAQTMGNGLQKRLDTPAGELSGGQRQALSFLMATLQKPEVLLLDEHTAALDPKTSQQLMATTAQRVEADGLTALMITHRLEDALQYGNRLIALRDGQITLDVRGDEKAALTAQDLLRYFEAY